MQTYRRVLVVDDNVATRYSIKRVLEHHGYRAEEAGTATEGRALLQSQDYDALVLDVNLPDMSGFDLVRLLRAEPRTSLLPVVHVSAASIATGDLVTGLEGGADAYLVHPVDHDILMATLRTLLRARQAEQALHASEARFREIFDHIGAPIAAVAADLDVRDANAAFRALMADAAADTLQALFGDQSVSGLREALRSDGSWQGTLTLKTRSGDRVTEWRVTPYKAPGVGLLYIDDRTEQHARETARQRELDSANSELATQIAERERAEIELQQALKMDSLGKLTGGIAHDFNNMLTGILGAFDMIGTAMQRDRLDRIPRYVDLGVSSALRAAALTQRMLAFARKQSLDTTSFDVVARLHAMADLLAQSTGENIALRFDVPDAELIAVADPNQLDNVVLNLVINARDALEGAGHIVVGAQALTLTSTGDLAAGSYISLTVTDDGPGMPPDVVTRVFEPFFTTKPIGKGTGLGLSMTYGFARQSGGTARVHTRVGKGTTVEVLIPSGAAVEADLTQETPRVEQGAGSVLLVDDNELVRAMALEVLVDAGYDVVTCPDSASALEITAARGFDLLLTDVGLPGISGRELADRVRAQWPLTQVLFITGYAEKAQNRQEFLGKGMDMLFKPFNLNDLLRAVRRRLV
ncbi:MAG: response regulator [Luteimonas sp.]